MSERKGLNLKELVLATTWQERYNGKLDYEKAPQDAMVFARLKLLEDMRSLDWYRENRPGFTKAMEVSRNSIAKWSTALRGAEDNDWVQMKLCIIEEGASAMYRTGERVDYALACGALAASLPSKPVNSLE
jgi:hypothetical protein